MKKSLVMFAISLILFSSYASALTGSIGNARMLLKAEVGDNIEKYVLVKNVNDIAVNIKMSVAGDLEKDLKLNEESFVLSPGEEKRAYFTIKARKAGTYETRILVQFSAEGEKTGVGLSSTILLSVYGEGELPEEAEEVDGEEDEENNSEITGRIIGEVKTNLIIILPITTLVLLVIFLFVLIKTRNRKIKIGNLNKKRSDRSK